MQVAFACVARIARVPAVHVFPSARHPPPVHVARSYSLVSHSHHPQIPLSLLRKSSRRPFGSECFLIDQICVPEEQRRLR